ncbi:MAG TPA: glycoside hydrolase family 30 beta sandwich domain-containing protein [Polyangia bacterium]|nr:glycoside hydrolase family 30 beta sandwich domain-containing protein [Polyangia bacterium]
MRRSSRNLLVATLAGALSGWGCGTGAGGGGTGTGGTSASGGSNAQGGTSGAGGAGSGGTSASGGNGSSGGATGAGGSVTGSGGRGGSGAGGSGTGGSGSGGSATGGSSAGGAGGSGAGGTGTGGSGTGGGGAGGAGKGGSGTGGAATGGSGGASSTCGGGTVASGDVTIDVGSPLQTMDGFGISNAFQGTAITDATADQFFDPNKGIGLSIFRLGIDSTGASLGPIGDAQKAAARGAIVWASPWTPPAGCKSNNSLTNGGTLNTTNNCYASWATTLAGFVATAKQSGVTVMGISAQNEPDNTTPYDSCIFSNDQMVAFIKVLGPKLKALSPPVKLLAPEATRWEDLWGGTPNKGSYSYGTAILADSTAAGQVDILATHQYETQDVMAPPAGVSKPIWETEMSGVMGYPEAGPSSDIADGIVWAGWIYDAITTGQATAWHAWWMSSLNADNEGLLLMGGGSTKRFYTVGNYSKFIRPGYRRVTVSGTPPSGVKLTAYQNPADGTIVVVAINGGTSAVALPIFLSGGAPCSMTPWVTTSSDNLASKPAVSVSGSRLAPMLAAQSVTTLVGKP